MRKLLARNRRLKLEMLPPWAPDLNPVESVWPWLNYVESVKFTPKGADQLRRDH